MYNPNLHFHFIGIGGAGMSGIAEVLLNQGFQVSGSDKNYTPVCERLERAGANIFQGHALENVSEDVSLIVYSSAIPADNPEILIAKERRIPVIRRAEVLAELMRLKYGVAVAGSHGKTSTASMIAAIMEEGELDPTAIIGGIVHSYGSTGKLGQSEYLVAEADESDKSFLLLKPSVAVITNIDDEHLEAYGSSEKIDQAFSEFLHSVPFYGLAVLCNDDLRVKLAGSNFSGRKTTYAINADADYQAEFLAIDFTGTKFNVYFKEQLLGEIHLSLIGKHFMQNALAAIAVGMEFGVNFKNIQAALKKFAGVSRRLEFLGEVRGSKVISDYAHHPVEIKAALRAIKDAQRNEGEVVVVFQPHRYTRTRDCWDNFKTCFKGAKKVFISDIYSAGEPAIDGITAKRLAEEIGSEAMHCSELKECFASALAEINANDTVLCMGAGSIGTFVKDFIKEHAGSNQIFVH